MAAVAEDVTGLVGKKKHEKRRSKQNEKRRKRRKWNVHSLLESMDLQPTASTLRTELSDTLLRLAGKTAKDSSGIVHIDWASMPESLDMMYGGETARGKRRGKRKGDDKRQERKKRQCEAFAFAIAALHLPDGAIIVDFGCGSCGLTLPLAFHFPQYKFVGVDLKMGALELMGQRAQVAQLENVGVSCGTIEAYAGDFSLAISLHACGTASDAAIEQAVNRNMPYFVAPCCIGKVKFNMSMLPSLLLPTMVPKEGYVNRMSAAMPGIARCKDMTYPRSKWLSGHVQHVLEQQYGVVETDKVDHHKMYADLAASADYSCSFSSSSLAIDACTEDVISDRVFYESSSAIIGMDRNKWAAEVGGYEVHLCTMPGLLTSAKSDILIGWRKQEVL
jgi:hypothetical protein